MGFNQNKEVPSIHWGTQCGQLKPRMLKIQPFWAYILDFYINILTYPPKSILHCNGTPDGYRPRVVQSKPTVQTDFQFEADNHKIEILSFFSIPRKSIITIQGYLCENLYRRK